MDPAIQCCAKDVIGAIAAHLLHGEEACTALHDADSIVLRFLDHSEYVQMQAPAMESKLAYSCPT